MLFSKLEETTELFARKAIERSVGGQAACFILYQEKIPSGAEKFKKKRS